MGAMLGLVMLSFLAAGVQSMLWTNFEWMVSAVLPAVIVEETNSERGGVGALRRSTTLDTAATMKANHMAQNGYFSHYSPDGVSPWYWFNQAGYSFLHAGENLAVHFTDSEDIVEAWMNSPTHRANIMNGQFTEIGIGVARGEFEGSDTIFVVQLFGTPTQAAPVVATTPAPAVAAASENNEPEPTPVVEESAPAEPERAEPTPTPAATTPTPAQPAPTQPAVAEVDEPVAETPAAVEVREDAATAERAEIIPTDTEEELSLIHI